MTAYDSHDLDLHMLRTTNPCPSWCTDEPGHVYDEECNRSGVVTRLTRTHNVTLGTVFGRVLNGPAGRYRTLTYDVALWVTEDADPETEKPRIGKPTVVMSEAINPLERQACLAELSADQAEALSELMAVGAKACRDIAAGREPIIITR